MILRIVSSIAVVFIALSLSAQAGRAGQAADPSRTAALQVYLPRQVTVKDGQLALGNIGILRGEGTLVAKAATLGLGSITMPGQAVVLDRATILSRLASSGIGADAVRLTGAEKVTIRQQQQWISSEQFLQAADAFLKTNPPAESARDWQSLYAPREIVLTSPAQDLELRPSLVKGAAPGYFRVRVEAIAEGQAVAAREIPYRVQYNARQVVALEDLAAGAVLTPQNVKIEQGVSTYPETKDWKPPYGLAAKRPCPKGTVIRADMVEVVKPEVTVNRNEMVVIRIERPGLVVTAVGMAIEKGRSGEFVKVRNIDSQRIILCRVKDDGTVEPVF